MRSRHLVLISVAATLLVCSVRLRGATFGDKGAPGASSKATFGDSSAFSVEPRVRAPLPFPAHLSEREVSSFGDGEGGLHKDGKGNSVRDTDPSVAAAVGIAVAAGEANVSSAVAATTAPLPLVASDHRGVAPGEGAASPLPGPDNSSATVSSQVAAVSISVAAGEANVSSAVAATTAPLPLAASDHRGVAPEEGVASQRPAPDDSSAIAFSQLATLQAGGRVKFQVLLFSLTCSPTVHMTLASLRSKLPAWPITWFTNSGDERKFAQRLSADHPVRLIELPRVVNHDLMAALNTREFLDAVEQSDKYLYVEPDVLLLAASAVKIDEFFEYDYVGAPWPPHAHWVSSPGIAQVGNGGCSFGTSSVFRRNVEYASSEAGKADLASMNIDVVLSSRAPNRPLPDVAVRFASEVSSRVPGLFTLSSPLLSAPAN
jgi:hypothetical protein